MRLGELLIGQGLATHEDIAAALERQQRHGGRLGSCLVAMGVIRVDQLVTILRSQQEAEAALGLCQRALHRSQLSFGREHPNTFRAHYNLGRALLAAGQAAEAATHAEAAHSGHHQAFGSGHAWTRDSAQLLANARHAATRVASSREAAAQGA
ncbi:MAG: tetratricopeptide repeat protein [Alphaproteobacteria bacterium]|nr:tetratricopeptide repeat protein [Alphaproteobacteria bacterium]